MNIHDNIIIKHVLKIFDIPTTNRRLIKNNIEIKIYLLKHLFSTIIIKLLYRFICKINVLTLLAIIIEIKLHSTEISVNLLASA